MFRYILLIVCIFTSHCVVRHNRIIRPNGVAAAAKPDASAEKVPMVWVFHETGSYDAVFWENFLKQGKSGTVGFAEATHNHLTGSRVIERQEHAPLHLDMKSSYHQPSYGWTALFCILTLGIFPSVEEIERKTDFSLRDRRTNNEIKKYTYVYRDTTYYSWLTIPVNLLVTPFVTDLSGQTGYKAQDIEPVKQAEIFENDFARDARGKSIDDSLLRPQIAKPAVAILRPISRSPEKDSLSTVKLAQTTLEDDLVTYQVDLRNRIDGGGQSEEAKEDFERFAARCKETAAKTGARYVIRIELLSLVFDIEKQVHAATFQGQIGDIKADKFHNFGPVRFADKVNTETSRRAGKFFAHKFLRQLQGFKDSKAAQ
mgnify:CR=1 FL=1